MNRRKARVAAVCLMLVGVLISLPTLLSTLVSFVKSIYSEVSSANADNEISRQLANQLTKLISTVYENTRFFDIFWNYSPNFDLQNYTSQDNIPFLLVYLSLLFGVALFVQGIRVLREASRVDALIKDEKYKILARREMGESGSNSERRDGHPPSQDSTAPAAVPNDSDYLFDKFIVPLAVTVIGGLVALVLGAYILRYLGF